MTRKLILCIVIASVVACNRDPAETGPTESELRSRLSTELPAYVELTNFDLRASQNVGDKVQPVFKTRFEGEIRLREDTFAETSRESGIVFVTQVLPRGERRKIYGLAVAALKAGAWQTQVQFDADPFSDLGRPKSMVGAGRVIVRGSSEETEFRAQQERERSQVSQAATERARKAEANLQQLLSSVPLEFTGGSGGPLERWPMQVRIASHDRASNKIAGEVEWPTLSAVHRMEGTLVGGMLVLREVDYIKKGKAVLGCVYELQMEGDRSLAGTWGRCDGSSDTGRTELTRR